MDNLYASIENVIFELSCIMILGEVANVKKSIWGKSLHSILVACNLKKGSFFLYNETPYKQTSNSSQMNILLDGNFYIMYSQNINMVMSQYCVNFYDCKVG